MWTSTSVLKGIDSDASTVMYTTGTGRAGGTLRIISLSSLALSFP